MSRTLFSPARVPYGTDAPGGSVDDRIRPGLRRAYPLPDDDGDDRFQRLLDALARRTGPASQPRPAHG